MGCIHSKGSNKRRAETTSASAATPQILFLGLPGAGKTTLMYKTLITEWSYSSNQAPLPPTAAFHYERMQRGKLQIGFWDLSGNPALRSAWSAFYHYVDVWVVVYIINILECSSLSYIIENREYINNIIKDNCLLNSSIIIIYNTMGINIDKDSPRNIKDINNLLGLFNLNNKDIQRIKIYYVNCLLGLKDNQWINAYQYIQEKIHKILSPPPPPPMRAHNHHKEDNNNNKNKE